MLIGFVVVIIMILVIVGLMSTGNNGAGDTGVYSTQVKKVAILINNIKSEGIIYHGLKDHWTGFNANYLQGVKIGTDLYSDSDADVDQPMTKNNWDNLPDDFNCDGTDESNTTDYLGQGRGVFLFKGFEPGNQQAILINSCEPSDGSKPYTEIRIIKQHVNTYDPLFDKILEKTLMKTDKYYYGA